MMAARRIRSSTGIWIGLVLLVALLVRGGLFFVYQPVSYSDTASYRRLAASIQNGWERYDGTRTPGYPILLAAAGPDETVWITQMALGVIITLLFFSLGYKLSGEAWFGGLAALAHTLNLGQLFFEANLITETLATFWVIVTLVGTAHWLHSPARRTLPFAFFLGLAAALGTLTRPLFIYLPAWTALFVAVEWRQPQVTRRIWDRLPFQISPAHAAAFLLPGVLLIGGWASFIHERFNVWSLSAMTGYHLIQHTGNYFEYLPEEEAALRDTYLKYREAQIASTGSQTNAIWEAIPEMQKASGLSFYALSRHLTDLSIQLILVHPDLYLQRVVRGWWLFWRAPVYWQETAFKVPGLVPAAGLLVLLERGVLFFSNLVFVVTSLAALAWRGLRARWRIGPAIWYLAGTVWFASILQTMLDHGDNPRFLVPLQSVVVFWVLWIGVQTIRPPQAQ
jgi:hypothetical protein